MEAEGAKPAYGMKERAEKPSPGTRETRSRQKGLSIALVAVAAAEVLLAGPFALIPLFWAAQFYRAAKESPSSARAASMRRAALASIGIVLGAAGLLVAISAALLA